MKTYIHYGHAHYDKTLYWYLYGWDCDSILVLNPDAVEEIKRDV